MSNKIRVAIVGVGNCASSFVQGVEFYKDERGEDPIPGLMHNVLGGYGVGDVEFVCAFDVDTNKVGHDIGEAIYRKPNNTMRFADVNKLGAPVLRGPTFDGLGEYYQKAVTESAEEPVDVAATLRAYDVDVMVSYLPVGSELATRHYIQQALDAGVAVVNCIPVFIASDPEWERKFKEAGLPIVGDDIKSQVGATIVHRQLAKLFEDRGINIDHMYQLNFGGNMDFQNMLERSRLASKKLSKTNSVRSNVTQEIADGDVHIGPSDHVPWLDDRKWAYIRLEGRGFGNAPMSVELKLEVWDSPNSAGVVIDAVRLIKLALNNGIAGQLDGPSSYLMKSPHTQRPDDQARIQTEEFIAEHARTAGAAKAAEAAKQRVAEETTQA
jgi:myo-inositol-1-phosphate synthase